jgi:hypothetical protein
MSDQLIQLTPLRAAAASEAQVERRKLERQARLLAWGGIGYHILEAAIAIGAGLAAGSIALIGFGADSLIESLGGLVVLWLFTGARLGSHTAERRAQQLVAVSFFVLAAYVGVESLRSLIGGHEPDPSWIGIGLAAFTAPDDAAARRLEAPRRPQAELGGSCQRGVANAAVRVPLDRAPDRPGGERAVRPLVDGPGRSVRHRCRRDQGGSRKLARRRLLRSLLTVGEEDEAIPPVAG